MINNIFKSTVELHVSPFSNLSEPFFDYGPSQGFIIPGHGCFMRDVRRIQGLHYEPGSPTCSGYSVDVGHNRRAPGRHRLQRRDIGRTNQGNKN